LFSAQAPVTLGLNVSIQVLSFPRPNTINACLRLPVPVVIFSSPTFDATKVDPSSVTLADGSVLTVVIKGTPIPLATTLFDVNHDGLPDLTLLIDIRTMTLSASTTSVILEGTDVQNLGNGNTRNVPIFGQAAVRVVTNCRDH
jgi:hypothetical protein